MSEWINVKDRLPELTERTHHLIHSSDRVLVSNGAFVEIADYSIWTDESMGPAWIGGPDEDKLEGVTHWMPKPEPPK